MDFKQQRLEPVVVMKILFQDNHRSKVAKRGRCSVESGLLPQRFEVSPGQPLFCKETTQSQLYTFTKMVYKNVCKAFVKNGASDAVYTEAYFQTQ